MAAYQGPSVVVVLPQRGGPDRLVRLAQPGTTTNGPDMVDPDLDPATGTLCPASKSRGLADCGLSGSWLWSGDAFRLKALLDQD